MSIPPPPPPPPPPLPPSPLALASSLRGINPLICLDVDFGFSSFDCGFVSGSCVFWFPVPWGLRRRACILAVGLIYFENEVIVLFLVLDDTHDRYSCKIASSTQILQHKYFDFSVRIFLETVLSLIHLIEDFQIISVF